MPCRVAESEQGPFRLADGRLVWLRSLRADDAPRLIELGHRLSPETVRRRFFREQLPCNPDETRQLAAVDQVRNVAVAVVPCPAASGPIFGVGRFHADGAERAELALLVEDAYQHVGLGRLLLAHLIGEAERRHISTLHGYALYDNTPLLRLLRTTGRRLEARHHAGGVLVLQLQLLAGHRHGSV